MDRIISLLNGIPEGMDKRIAMAGLYGKGFEKQDREWAARIRAAMEVARLEQEAQRFVVGFAEDANLETVDLSTLEETGHRR